MARKNTKRNWNNLQDLYTTQAPSGLQELVRSIPTRFGTSFQTRAFKPPGKGTLGTRWLEAVISSETNLWDIKKCEKVSNSDSPAEIFTKRKTHLKGLCLFDALHLCAYIETTEPVLGVRPTGEKPEDMEDRHYIAFAAREGLPCDIKSMPHPAASGRILTDGDFPENADEIAKNSAENVLALALEARKNSIIPSGFFDQGTTSGAIESMSNYQFSMQRADSPEKQLDKHIEKFNKAADGVPQLFASLHNAANKNFERFDTSKFDWDELGEACTPLAGLCAIASTGIGILLTAPLIPSFLLGAAVIPGFYTAHNIKSLRKAPKKALSAFRKNVETLPDSAYKDELHTYANDIEFNMAALQLRQAYRDAETGSFFKKRHLDQSLTGFFNAAGKKGITQKAAETLQVNLRKNLASRTFDTEILSGLEKNATLLTRIWDTEQKTLRENLKTQNKMIEEKTQKTSAPIWTP